MKIHKNQLINYKPANHMKKVGLISNAILRIANVNRATHSRFDNFHHVLIKMKVRINVRIRIHTEKILSLNNIVQKLASHPWAKRQVGWRFNGVITDEIPIIQRILNISDHTTLPTHISYFFFIIAASVAATSGSDVPAATMVAQIAHSDTQNDWAINTAAFTTKSEDRTSIHKLARSFVQFNIIHNLFSHECLFLLRNNDIRNQISNTAKNIVQYSHIHTLSQNVLSIVSQVMKHSRMLIQNRI